MFNFNNLNDYEFEELAKDILEKMLDISLNIYPKGKDGGIDLYDEAEDTKLIVQVKHYVKTPKSKLIKDLKNEKRKIEKLDFESYYIIVSQHLSLDDKHELYKHFNDFMSDETQIIDGAILNDFLEEDENLSILKKHTKLWLTSSNILDVMRERVVDIDTEMLLEEIEEKKQLMVITEQFEQLSELLEQKNVMTLVGNPGVGKTTLSYLLILKYINQGYTVRYASNQSISDLKNSLSLDINRKELVFLDDFVGQNYLKINDEKPNELKSLMKWVTRKKSKKLIMNSRTTILEEASRKYSTLKEMIESTENEIVTVDCDQMSYKDKGLILYNHLFHNEIKQENYKRLLEGNYLRQILNHNNYNPRIIEFCSINKNVNLIEDESYPEFILRKLKNPEEVWEDEYTNRLSEEDRVYLQVLYSLTDTDIEIDKFEAAFNNVVKVMRNIDKTQNQFQLVTNRLNGSMVKLLSMKNTQHISVFNPSVNDFLNVKFQSKQISDFIIENSLFIDQQLKIIENLHSPKDVKLYLESYKFNKKESIKKNEYFWYIYLAVKYYDNENDKIRHRIYKSLDEILQKGSIYSEEHNFLKLINLISKDKKNIFSNDYKVKILNKTLSIIPYQEFLEVLENLKDETNREEEFEEILENITHENLEDIIIHQFERELEDELLEYISDGVSIDLVEKAYDIDSFEMNIKDEIIFDYDEKLRHINNELREYFPAFDTEIDIDKFIDSYDLIDMIEEEISFTLKDMYDFDSYKKSESNNEEYEKIETLFKDSKMTYGKI